MLLQEFEETQEGENHTIEVIIYICLRLRKINVTCGKGIMQHFNEHSYGLQDEIIIRQYKLTWPENALIMNCSACGSTHSMHFCTTWFPFWSFTHFRT
jgi:hypothetical protein